MRSGTAADIDAMYRLDCRCFDEVFRFSRRAMRRLTQAPENHVLLAETTTTVLAGFSIVSLYAKDKLAYIVTLDIAPEHRRLGLARLLLQRAEAHAVAARVSDVELHVSTVNMAAIALYRACGYVEVLLEPDFYAPGLHASVMRKHLHPSLEPSRSPDQPVK